MPTHRYYIPDRPVFITQVVEKRRPIFRENRGAQLWLETLRAVKVIHPFSMVAYVLLPEHFHLLIIPQGSETFSTIMHSLKRNFSADYYETHGGRGQGALWQKGFFDHVIRDEEDLHHHLDYIHFNPVKHCVAVSAAEWPYSTFSAWCERGAYSLDWRVGCAPGIEDVKADLE